MPTYNGRYYPVQGGEDPLAAALLSLGDVVNQRLSARDQRKAEERKQKELDAQRTQQVNANLKLAEMNIAAGMAQSRLETEEKQEAARVASAATAATESKKAAQQQRIASLLKVAARDNTDGQNAVAELTAMGVPAASVSAVRGEKAPVDLKAEARDRRLGTLEAEKTMAVGAFAPKPGPPTYTPVQLRAKAKGAIQTHAAETFAAYPNATAGMVLKQVLNDPENAALAQNPNWVRELTSSVELEVNRIRNEKSKKGGGLGARATAVRR